MRLDIDEFGQSFDAFFNPLSPIDSGDVFYDSSVLISQGNSIRSLGAVAATENRSATILSQSDSEIVSRFTINQLQFTLTQTVADAITSGQQSGSVLTQRYAIRNLTDVPNSFDLYRYLDGDLYLTDTSLDDAGGQIGSGAGIVLYQTDLLDGQTVEDTFVGITAVGGKIPETGRFEIARCCGVPAPLNDTVFGDDDGDGRTDSAYDVTLSLRNSFTIGVGQSAVYTTTTLFGNGELPEPGSSESLPLLPNAPSGTVDAVDAFVFDIPVQDIVPGQTIWIDPVIAVGYTYEVEGAEFESVTAPSPATVPDGDGEYTLMVGGMTFTLSAGEEFVFSDPVTMFEITGIDPSLELDPDNPLAFVTGISLTNVASAGTVRIVQTPITVDTEAMAPVPLPASVLLMGVGMAGLVVAGRRRRV